MTKKEQILYWVFGVLSFLIGLLFGWLIWGVG